jgi:hypothetical protein
VPRAVRYRDESRTLADFGGDCAPRLLPARCARRDTDAGRSGTAARLLLKLCMYFSFVRAAERAGAQPVSGRIGNELLIYLSSLALQLPRRRENGEEKRPSRPAPPRPESASRARAERNCSAYRDRDAREFPLTGKTD